jgi:hypothetical protein
LNNTLGEIVLILKQKTDENSFFPKDEELEEFLRKQESYIKVTGHF